MAEHYAPAEGDLVDVVIRGAIVYALPDPEDEPGEGYTTVAMFDGERRELTPVNLSYPQVSITPSAAGRIATVLAEHAAEVWTSGSGPGYGWTCGYEIDRPSSPVHRPGCGATSPRARDGEYRHGFYDTAAEADAARRQHLGNVIAKALGGAS